MQTLQLRKNDWKSTTKTFLGYSTNGKSTEKIKLRSGHFLVELREFWKG